MRRVDAIIAASVIAIAVGAIAAFWLGGRRLTEETGFPLDDAWIHIRFAQNFAERGEFSFNPGSPTAGSTSPLWVLLLAGISVVLKSYVAGALLLGITGYFCLIIMTWLVLRRALDQSGPAMLAALTVAVNPRILWGALSGMEICLAAFLAVAAAGLFVSEEVARPNGDPGMGYRNLWAKVRYWSMPALLGLASLARPEAHLLFALAVFLRVARSCRRDTAARELFRLIPYQMIVVYLLTVLPWHLFAHFSSGSVLPNTFWANFRGLASRLYPSGYYYRYGQWLFVRDHPFIYSLILPGIVATLIWTVREMRHNGENVGIPRPALVLAQLSSLWVILYPLVSRVVLPMMRHHARYMVPLTPFHAILAALGIWALVSFVAKSFGVREGTADASSPSAWRSFPPWIIVSVLVVVSAVPYVNKWSEVYGRNVYSINHQHVLMARWISDNSPPDAVIATHDIGALGAVSRRRIVDVFGLVSPEMIRRGARVIIPTLGGDGDWYLGELVRDNVSYLVGYPEWLPFREGAPECFEEVYTAALEQKDICGGRKMVAWRVDRERLARTLENR